MLHIARERLLSFKAVNTLIQAGADLNQEVNYGLRPLHVSAIGDEVETVRAILQTSHSTSPLATYMGQQPCIFYHHAMEFQDSEAGDC